MLPPLDPNKVRAFLEKDVIVTVKNVLDAGSSQQEQKQRRRVVRGPQIITELPEDHDEIIVQHPLYKYTVTDGVSSAFVIVPSHKKPWKVNTEVKLTKGCEIWRGVIIDERSNLSP